MGAGVRADRRDRRRRRAGGELRGRGRAPAREVSSPTFAAVDGALGAALTACVGLLVAWVLGAVALQAAPDIRRDVQRSAILRELNAVLPPTGPLLNTLRALDPFPRIDGPQARVGRSRRSQATARCAAHARAWSRSSARPAASASRARAGWPSPAWSPTRTSSRARTTRACCPRPGARARGGGDRVRPAQRPGRVARLGTRGAVALEEGDPEAGTSAAILGFPLNGGYDVRAGRLGQTREVVSQDAYGRGRCGARSSRCAAVRGRATRAGRWSTARAGS